MQYQDPRAAEARRLRTEENLSSKEIRERLGVDRAKLQYWLAGLGQNEALRPNAKDHLRHEARRLRQQGMTYPEISEQLGVSKSSISLWVRDIAMPQPDIPASWTDRARMRRAENLDDKRSRRLSERLERQAALRTELSPISDRDVLINGAIAYWCEGSKAKPWRPHDVNVIFTNTDPDLIRLFLRFLEVVPVEHGGPTFRVHIHESADDEEARSFWSRELGLGLDDFKPTLWKRHNPTTVRKNTGDDYHGCLVVRVRRSSRLYWYIEDLAKAAMTVMSIAVSDRQQVA